nr:type 4b pilus protein PilO2 [Methylomarinum sp. Ch1-1]MDP4523205.1 type 4b pilus protein PilO2 [Methylomarinum sp. Ch1-1]
MKKTHGLQVGLTLKQFEKQYSLAAIVANKSNGKSFILIQPIDDHYWLFACANHMVLPGGDRYIEDFDEVVSIAHEFTYLSQFEIFAPEVFQGEFDGNLTIMPAPLDEIAGDKALANNQKDSSAIIDDLDKGGVDAKIIGLVFLIAALAGITYYLNMEDEPEVVENPVDIAAIQRDLSQKSESRVVEQLAISNFFLML